jgi:RND family efflux transporter MFP subunit
VNKFKKYTAPILVLALGFGGYMLLLAIKPEPEKREQAARPVTVFVEKVSSSTVQLDVVTEGEVRSRVAIDLVAQVSGRVMSVAPAFTEGGNVMPGETLVTIEDIDYQLALKQASARVAAAQVQVELALADADVARKQLRGTKNPSDLALKKPQLAEARAQLLAAEADLQQAQVNLERTRVSLPFKGRIEDTYVDLGQFVSAGTPLGRAFATDKVEVRLPITDDQLASLDLPIGYEAEPGGGLDTEFSATVAGREHQWQGKLVRLDASIDSSTRLLYALAEVDDPYGTSASGEGMPMAVGLYVNGNIRGRRIEDAIRIPRSALRAGNTVYVVNSDGRLEVRTVQVTHSSPNYAVISEGLSASELVIISTIRNPIPGMALQANTSATDTGALSANPAEAADGAG